jgi:peptidoglycan/LPS O-acetylase OafA/YrhL
LGILFPPRAPASRESRLPDGRWSSRYESLDHLRGIAAIGIVLHHAAHIDFRLGTGRVLLFFVISGYCIAASTESCKRRGMRPAEFFWRRVHRIYPPYLFALLFWAGTRLVKWMRSGQNELIRSPLEWIQNVTLTQWLTMVPHPISHPGANKTLFVAAFWSLCYEEQFYLVMGGLFALTLAVPRLRIWPMMLGLAALSIGWGLLHPVSVRGIFLEFWISFTLGATAYYRLSVFTDRRICRLIDAAVAIVVALSIVGLQLDPRVPQDADRSKWLEWLIAAVFYFVLIALRPADASIARARVLAPLRAIGRITYSLYLIHQFNLSLIAAASSALLRMVVPGYRAPVTAEQMAWYDIVLQVLLHICLASVFWLFCEYPFLNRAIEGSARTGERASRAAVGRGVGGDGVERAATADRPAPVLPEAASSRDG